MKRTTLMLKEGRLQELRRLAAKEERTISELVDEILREGIRQRQQRSRRHVNVQLPTFTMGQAAGNVADRDQLEELMKG